MKIKITRNYKDGNRYRYRGQELNVVPWKAEELINKKVAKFTDVETLIQKEDN